MHLRFWFVFFVSTLLNLAVAWAQTFVCVSKSGALLRKDPKPSAEVTWKVPLHMPLLATGERKNGFLEVQDIDGEMHWVSSREVSTRRPCVVVRSKKVRLRTGPGNQFEVSPIGAADRYTSFLDQGGEDGWTKVEDELGQTGWLNLDSAWKPTRRLRMSFQPE